ncbi:HPr family phosphocarrier protein [Rosistilla carotiformis]|nr:HPr family phosphocarrier protein [Rosistilla carotiformis]
MSNPTCQQIVVVKNEKGLHLRPAELLARLAMQFESTVMVTKDDQSADCKNMLSVLTLGAVQGTPLGLSAEGSDAVEALAAVAELFDQGFHELDSE